MSAERTRPPLSVLVTTGNEADQIVDCLSTVTWADEVHVVDSFSTDGTPEVIRSNFPQVTVEQHEYFGAGAQKIFAVPRLKHDWVLVVDADERITDELRKEIERTLENPKLWAYEIGRQNFMLGAKVSFGGMQRDRVTRLFHRQHAIYQNRRVHAEVDHEGPKGRLKAKMDHYYIRAFDHMIRKMTNYGIWSAANHFRHGKRGSVLQVIAHPFWRFVRDYFLWFGFLDGARGLILAGMHVYYAFWKYAKLWEYTELERQGLPIPLPPFDEEVGDTPKPWEKKS